MIHPTLTQGKTRKRSDPLPLSATRAGTPLARETIAASLPCTERAGEVGAAYVRWPDGRRGVLTAGCRRRSGPGTLSSSDGQRFPFKGKSITARHLCRYFARGQGISTYTHVSDQHSTYDTMVSAVCRSSE